MDRQKIADDYALWCQYVDPGQTMTEEEFNDMTDEEKLEMQDDIFGPEETDDYDEGEPPSDFAADAAEGRWSAWRDHCAR